MPERSLKALQDSLREEQMILEAASEDVSYHTRMAAMRKRDADRAKHHCEDLEETIAVMTAEPKETTA